MRLDYAANAFPIVPQFKTSPKEINTHKSDSKFDVELELFENNNSCLNSTSNSNIDEVTDNSVTNNQSHINSNDDSYSIQAYSKVDSLSSNETCPLNFQENWLGLTEHFKRSGPIKKGSYLDKCPEWDNVTSQNVVFLPIMKNGNTRQPVKLKGETIMLRNTCAFDVLLQCTVHMIGMHVEYKRIVQTIKDCNFLQLATKIASRGKITKNEYVERASFLTSLSLFQQAKYTRRFYSLDTMCNAAHLAEYTFMSLPSLQRQKICTFCHYINERKFTAVSVNVDILLQKGLEHIQAALNDTRDIKQICPKCNNLCKIKEEYGPHITIDTSVFSDTNYIKDIGLEPKTYNLDSIAKNITMGDKKYILRGVVNYFNNIKHYTALLYTNISWYEYDDLKSKRTQVSPTNYNIVPHVLLYAQIE